MILFTFRKAKVHPAQPTERSFPSRATDKFVVFAVFLFLGLTPSKTWSQSTAPTPYLGDVRGYVNYVENDGTVFLTLESGNLPNENQLRDARVTLWGLKLTDAAAVDEFLKGRILDCKIVHLLGPLPEVDCVMSPRDQDGRPIVSSRLMRGQISVFDWLTDLGLATQQCPTDYGYYEVSDNNGRIWYCWEGISNYHTGRYD